MKLKPSEHSQLMRGEFPELVRESLDSTGQPEDERESTEEGRRRCPDDGACHHGCRPGECWRVHNACPLSAYGEEWPAEIRKLSATRRLSEQSHTEEHCDHDWEWKNVNPARPWQQRRVCTICAAEDFQPTDLPVTDEIRRRPDYRLDDRG